MQAAGGRRPWLERSAATIAAASCRADGGRDGSSKIRATYTNDEAEQGRPGKRRQVAALGCHGSFIIMAGRLVLICMLYSGGTVPCAARACSVS